MGIVDVANLASLFSARTIATSDPFKRTRLGEGGPEEADSHSSAPNWILPALDVTPADF